MALVDVLAAIVFKTQSNPRARMQLVGYICGALSERIENA
jgi:hypothetical protein